MAVIRPFRALRVNPHAAPRVAAPPYDTLSAAEARRMAAGNAESFLRIDKPEIEFPEHQDPYAPEVYQRGREILGHFVTTGVLVRELTPALYLYRQQMQGRTQTGLLAATSVDEYRKGLIRKHEHTRPEKVTDRARHIIGCQAQASPVLSTFRYDIKVDNIFREIAMKPPLIDFTGPDGTRQELWVVTEERFIKRLVDTFAQIPMLYIADGHHRSEAAAEVSADSTGPGATAAKFFLNGLFPDRDLFIMPYHRVVRDLNGMSAETFLQKLHAAFELEPASRAVQPTAPHTFGLYLGKRWYQLTAKPEQVNDQDPVGSIDAAVIARLLIEPLLGITNPRTDKRIDFVGGIRGTAELERLVNSGEFAIALSLPATTIEQLLTVADRKEVMPPKSTWFEPKLASGLVVYSLQE